MSLKHAKSRGYFITVEGIDGAGKTTFIERLKQKLSIANVIVTCEPTKSDPLGIFVRSALSDPEISNKTKALLFTADRAHHVTTVIAPALAAGKIVICDRYTESTIAYQQMIDDMIIDEVTEWATNGLQPDLTFFLDFEDDNLWMAYDRIARRGDSNERHVDKEQTLIELKQVQTNYRKLFVARREFMCLSEILDSKLRPQTCVVIDAAATPDKQDAAVDDHLHKVWHRIFDSQRLGEPLSESVH